MEIDQNNFHQFFLAKALICVCITLTVFYIHSSAALPALPSPPPSPVKKAMLYQNHLKIHPSKQLYRKNKSAFYKCAKKREGWLWDSFWSRLLTSLRKWGCVPIPTR